MEFGVIGMAVMGRNLAMNAASKGLKVAVFNRTAARTDEAVKEAERQGVTLHPFHEIKDFVTSLAKPRIILMMVQAGSGVDATIHSLADLLEPGDVLIDGGNEHWKNTDRRIDEIKNICPGIHYMAMGVSGGEEGARHGPSLMPGGDAKAYAQLEPVLKKIAAKSDYGVCCAYMGERSAGNYVKMVHNGIEYGDMQLIAETYDIMRKVNHYSNEAIGKAFTEWNKQSLLKSYLIDITALIFKVKDPKNNDSYLVDAVLDVAGSKGTGKWTVQEAADKGVPCPTIAAALDSRYLSGLREARGCAQKIFGDSDISATTTEDKLLSNEELHNALFCAKVCSYAQGMKLLAEASKVHNYNIDLSEVSLIWTGGCIIRADFLKNIHNAYKTNPNLENLLFDPWFASELKNRVPALRKVVIAAQCAGVAVPALSSSLNYFDALRSARLPLNLVQAQRDCFGAHTYVRKDCEEEGAVHSEWSC